MIRNFTFFLFVIATLKSYASNIQVTNVSLNSPDVSAGSDNAANFTMLQFDLTWENSWRISSGPSNWDAAWIFMKYRVGTGPWQHAFLNNTDHLTGTGTSPTITPGLQNTGNAFDASTNPAMGVFVHRSADGSGTFTQTGMQLRWNYGANGVTDLSVVDIKVFAIEMVYVPGGVDFNVGWGGGSGAFTSTTINTGVANIAPSGTGSLGGAAGGYPTGRSALGASWPNGYDAFYSMKYEITQGLYRDFLNTLTRDQQASRVIGNIASGVTYVTNRFIMSNRSALQSRNGVRVDATIPATDPVTFYCDFNSNGFGNEPADGENIACNYIGWTDGAAFSDWAGLRPMTEMEFEKACRGSLPAVANEYAWGTTTQTGPGVLADEGTASERSSTAVGNSVFRGNSNGPLRVGMFAGAATTREQAGATYFGIMEMSGSLYDICVSYGGSFTRQIHGNGVLTSDGFCDISSWPGYSVSKVSQGGNAIFKGGAWFSVTSSGTVSERGFLGGNDPFRIEDSGFRSVRTAQ